MAKASPQTPLIACLDARPPNCQILRISVPAQPTKPIAPLVLFLLGAIACGAASETGPDGVANTQFKATVSQLTTSGAMHTVLTGVAVIDVDPSGASAYALVLTGAADHPAYLAFEGIPSAIPDSAVYDVAGASSDAQLAPGHVRLVAVIGAGASASTALPVLDASGTLTFIPTRGHGDPRGLFAFNGSIPQLTLASSSTPNVTVEGGFDAALGDVMLVAK